MPIACPRCQADRHFDAPVRRRAASRYPLAIARSEASGCADMESHNACAAPDSSAARPSCPSAAFSTEMACSSSAIPNRSPSCRKPRRLARNRRLAALQSIVARETRPGEPLVVSINAIQGGSAANVTVEAVTLRGTIRWFSATERERGLARIEAIARGVGEALRVRIEFEVLGGAPVTSNVPEYAALVDEAVTDTGRATSVDGGPITATDDVAYLLDMAPGAFFGIGAGGPDAVPHHHPAFEIDERAIGLMSEILARAAIKALHHEAGESVRAEGP